MVQLLLQLSNEPSIEVSLAGSAVSMSSPVPRLVPPRLDFGLVAPNQIVLRTVWLLNDGATSLRLEPPLISGPFSWTSEPPRPTRIGARRAHGYLLLVRSDEGPVSGELTLRRPGEPDPLVVALTATVTRDGPTPNLRPLPREWDLGAVPRGRSLSRALRLFNDGRGIFELTSISIDDDANVFSVRAPAAGRIGPGGSVGLVVRFQDPTGFGRTSATLRLASPDLDTDMRVVLTAETINPPIEAPIVVQAEWSEPEVDVDLHVVGRGARLFDVPDDLTGCPHPARADPARRLIQTASAGPGLERAELDTAGLGPQRVMVSASGTASARVTVQIWSQGEFAGAVTRTVGPGLIWEVADLGPAPAWAQSPLSPSLVDRCY